MIKKIGQFIGVGILATAGIAAIIAFLGLLIKGVFLIFLLGYNAI